MAFNLDHDHPYEKVKDIVDMIKKKPARSKELIDAYEKLNGDIKLQ